jgi:hypothetical protein
MPPKLFTHESFNAAITTQTDDDLNNGIVRNARLLGPISKNSRRYPADVIKKAIPLYEGAFSNVGHKATPDVDTPPTARFGWFEGVRQTDDGGLNGDYHFNPEHPYAKEFRWWVKNNPKAIAFSHFAMMKKRIARENDQWVEVAESIDQVLSVDVVTDGGTTRGIYESANAGASDMDPKEIGKTLTTVDTLKAFMTELITASTLTADEKMAIVEDLLSSMDNAAPAADPNAATATESSRLNRLARRGKVGAFFAAKIVAQQTTDAVVAESNRKKARVVELAKEAGLPATVVTETLVTTFMNLAEESVKTTFAEMKKSLPAGGTLPTTTPPGKSDKSVTELIAEIWK